MNRDTPEKTDVDCNVCGSAVEVGSAWSRCSNSGCITRETDFGNEKPYDGLPSLSTDASDEDIITYWEARALAAEDDGPTQQEVDEKIESSYRQFKNAADADGASHYNGEVTGILPLSSYDGFGDLRMNVDT